VVEGDSLREIPVTEDTLAIAYSAASLPYARESWFTANEPVQMDGRTYIRQESPRVIPLEVLRFHARYQGVPIFGEAVDRGQPPLTIYIPLRPGCVFQSLNAVEGHPTP
jgi:hypothetical protein